MGVGASQDRAGTAFDVADRRTDARMSSTIPAHVLIPSNFCLTLRNWLRKLGLQMVLKAGIGRFSPELRLIFRPAVTKG